VIGIVTTTVCGIGCAQNEQRNRRIVLYTDLDGTLINNNCEPADDVAKREFERYWNEVERPNGSVLVYNTARSIVAYRGLAATRGLESSSLFPDVLITGEGTEIRWKSRDQGWVIDERWQKAIRGAWIDSGVGAHARALCEEHDEGHLRGLNDVSNAPPHGECRLAFTVLDSDKADHIVEALRARFGESVTVEVMMGWGPEPKPRLITIMPKIAGKGNAAQFVHAKLGAESSEALCAGDTYGDAAVLTTGFSVVCVGNSTEELLEARERQGQGELHYLAKASNAAGVLEGLKHHRRER